MSKEDLKEIILFLQDTINSIDGTDEKIEALNEIRMGLHEVSPLKHHPVDCVLWKKSEDVEANEYNPNAIAKPELDLLHTSIAEDGYTMSIVTFNEGNNIKIVDGFHRRLMERMYPDISESTYGRVPLTFIRKSQKDISDRMASTIRHNRARGSHSIDLMSNIVAELTNAGMSDAWILKHVGMDRDELLRLKQITGLASLFKDKDFSDAWSKEKTINSFDDED